MTATETTPLDFFITDEAWQALSTRLRLSPRELQIVRGICQERKESSIAVRLKLSPHTVRTHVERIYAKLGIGTRIELMLLLLGEFLCLTAQPGTPLPPICGSHTAGRCPLHRYWPTQERGHRSLLRRNRG